MSTTQFSSVHPMRESQQSTGVAGSGLWSLSGDEALRLPIGPGARELHVTHGRLWLTRTATAAVVSEDVWLRTGDSLRLDAGSEWVIEGWGEARFQLLVLPDICPQAQRLSARGGVQASLASSSPRAWPGRAATTG